MKKLLKSIVLMKHEMGEGFEPDFLLLLQNEKCYFQVFCEPKGAHLLEFDKCKNDFLKDITKCTNENKISLENINKNGLEIYENRCYKILGLSFYNFEDESEFKKEFYELL